jgi:hypothetical protein
MPRVNSRLQMESGEALREAYDNLVKAGQGSLEAAYAFGQVVDALNGQLGYSYTMLGDMIGRSAVTVAVYAKLYRKYPTVQSLIHMAEEMGTWDVHRLVSDAQTMRYRYVFHCRNCGSYDVARERAPEVTADDAALPARA